MSKKFHDDDRTLEVQENGGKINLYIEGKINELGVEIAPSDAPALALAILESAGWPEDDPRSATKQIMMWLGDVVRTVERITAEAEAQAKLEAEALELMNVRLRASGTTVHLTKATVDPVALEGWLAVARRARELNKEEGQ